jgi:sulfite reductase (ferredoxin)
MLPEDDRWTAFLDDLGVTDEQPTRDPQALGDGPHPHGFAAWCQTNVMAQRQPGYAAVTVTLPLGDLTSEQFRALARRARRYNSGRARTTVEQNIVLRWISQADLPDLYTDLVNAGLGRPGASTITDITACPGTDTCKLGISSSRGLAAELGQQLTVLNGSLDDAVKQFKIKVSGCFNSCGQHHVADLGFYGVSRKSGMHAVPHFQVVLGGQWTENAGAYGLATVAIPSKNIPEVVKRLTDYYVQERQSEETFQSFVKRVGKAKMRALLEDLTAIPAYTEDRTYYSDWGDPREYTLGDMGIGECAGEVVSLTEFGLSASERRVFEAQIELDRGDAKAAAETAFSAMLQAAKALIQTRNIDIADDPDRIVEEFKLYFYDTELFFDPYAGPKFANYLLRLHSEPESDHSVAAVHRRIEEAQLFIEAAHACYSRLGQQQNSLV